MNLPPLPARVHISEHESGYVIYGYTDKQMQEYALAAMAQAGAEPAYMADGSQAFRVDIVAAWPEKNRTTFTIPLYAAPTATAPLDPDTEFDKWCTSKRLDIEKMRNSSHGAMWAIVAFKDALALQRAAPQPAREPLTDAAIDAGIEAWFTTNITTNDGKDRGHPFRERMRAAIEAAHNITATPAAQGGTT